MIQKWLFICLGSSAPFGFLCFVGGDVPCVGEVLHAGIVSRLLVYVCVTVDVGILVPGLKLVRIVSRNIVIACDAHDGCGKKLFNIVIGLSNNVAMVACPQVASAF